jgi:hypothetical protein
MERMAQILGKKMLSYITKLEKKKPWSLARHRFMYQFG